MGKLADLVLWKPAFFGVKPQMVVKGGLVVAAQMGDPGASIPTPQPVYTRPMFAAFGGATASTCLHFVSGISLELGHLPSVGRRYSAVANTRSIGKKDMVLNAGTPDIQVNAETYEVRVDGELITCEPAETLPMAQKYFLFLCGTIRFESLPAPFTTVRTEPPVPFGHLGLRGAVPQTVQRLLADFLFEGSCTRAAGELAGILCVDHGFCPASLGETDPVFVEHTYFSSKVTVPRECSSCSFLRIDMISRAFHCGKRLFLTPYLG